MVVEGSVDEGSTESYLDYTKEWIGRVNLTLNFLFPMLQCSRRCACMTHYSINVTMAHNNDRVFSEMYHAITLQSEKNPAK